MKFYNTTVKWLFSFLLIVNSLSINAQELSFTHGELVSYTCSDVLSSCPKKLLTVSTPTYTSCDYSLGDRYIYFTFSFGEEFNYSNLESNANITIELVGYTAAYALSYSDNFSLGLTNNNPELKYKINLPSLPSSTFSYFEVYIRNYSFTDQNYITDNINLKMEMITDYTVKARHKTASYYSTPLCTLSNPTQSDGVVDINWTSSCEFPLCQIQILRLRNNSGSNLGQAEGKITATIDWNKAITLETEKTSLSFIPAEGTGWYFFRVRPIGNYFEGGIAENRNWGAWTSTPASPVTISGKNTYNKTWAIYYVDPNQDINSVINKKYSGGEKLRESIAYYNGLMMPKQEQIYLHSNEQMIVNQKMYDYAGKPSLQLMSAPADATSFSYQSGILTKAGSTYGPANFDDDDTYNNPDQASGSLSEYFSNSNEDLTIPTAGGYPFARSLYDGLGRVKEISSIGETHKIGEKTTSISYSGVMQSEMKYVLAKEALREDAVSKIITTDANNVTHVDIKDKSGNTIISHMTAGLEPDGYEKLSTRPEEDASFSTTLTENEAYGTYAARNSYSLHLQSAKTIFLTYALTKNDIQSNCLSYCSTCDYKVTVKITNIDDPENSPEPTSFEINPEDCSTDPEYNPSSFSYDLEAGSYLIEKIITINNEDFSTTTDVGETYLEQHQNEIDDLAEAEFESLLATVNTYLDDNDHEGLFAYLESMIASRPSVFSKTLKTSGDIDYYSIATTCCSIDIPYDECPSFTCPTTISDYEFESYLMEKFVEKYEEMYAAGEIVSGENMYWLYDNYVNPSAYSHSFLEALTANYDDVIDYSYGYSTNNLNYLFYHMLHDPDMSYTCEQLWSCWDAAIDQLITSMNYRDHYDYSFEVNIIKYFLNCTGYYYKGFVSSSDEYDNAVTTPYWNRPYYYSGGWKSHAYCLFPYSIGSNTDCEDALVKSSTGAYNWPSQQDGDLVECPESDPMCDTYADRSWDKFYLCTQGQSAGSATLSNTLRYYESTIEESCNETCESKRSAFEEDAKDILIEQNGSYSDGEVECLVKMMMGYCKEHCKLTIQYASGGEVLSSSPQPVISTSSPMVYFVNLTQGSLYRLVMPNPACGAAVYHDDKWYYPGSYYGDDFYATSSQCTVVVEYGYSCPTDAYVAEDLSEYSGLGTPDEQTKILKAMTYIPSVSAKDEFGNCKSGSALLDIPVPYMGTNMLTNSDLSAYPSTSTTCSSYPCLLNACVIDWSNSHGYPMVVEVDDANQAPRCAYLSSVYDYYEPTNKMESISDGIYYTPLITLISGKEYTLSFDIKLDDAAAAIADNVYVVLTSSVPGGFVAPVTTMLDQIVWHNRNYSSTNWKTVEVTFTASSSANNVLMIYPMQNAGSSKETAVLVDNIQLGLTEYKDCEDICFSWIKPELSEDVVEYTLPACEENIVDEIRTTLNSQIENCKQNMIVDFTNEYKATCANPESIEDQLTIEYEMGNFHYSLFYYDLAGRLIKTVPPAGIVASSSYSSSDYAAHKLTSTHHYNSIGQKVRYETPDGGANQYYYNALGQLRFSQNAQQLIDNNYAYMKYDALGRVTESGIGNLSSLSQNLEKYVDDNTSPLYGTETEQTYVVYTDAASGIAYQGETQKFLSNRISYTYNSAGFYTYYSYDALGNVKWLIQTIPGLGNAYIGYEYDIISGIVTKIKYNEGFIDQYFIKFEYDDDKRLRSVYTSKDNALWDKDANYEYYAHGPLKRVLIGEDRLQGIDYVYTIQGLLKAINHPSLQATNDPGNDGESSTTIPGDAFGMSLHYYEGDFERSYAGTSSSFNSYHSTYVSPTNNLYNGTISAITSKIGHSAGKEYEQLTAEKYTYDELMRLTASDFNIHDGSSWSTTTDFNSTTAYDANGNIVSMNRTAYQPEGVTDNLMDVLTYNYTYDTDGYLANHQLQNIKDEVSASDFNDIDDQSASTQNYTYDAIGRLLTDDAEGLQFEWNNQSKIIEVTQMDGGDNLEFKYDALGNRVIKEANPASGTASTTYYVRDAKGNIMARYTHDGTILKLEEVPIQGTKRLGIWMPEMELSYGTSYVSSTFSKRNIGEKKYELTDHLGNIRVVISDKKLASDNGDGTYTLAANIQSYSNYYPFGMEQPGRTYQSSDYHYGFNGKEKDEEMKGIGNSLDFGARMYDPRIGRWLSMDPLAAKFPEMSPFNGMENNPINMIDPDGREVEFYGTASLALGPELKGKLGIKTAAEVKGSVGASVEVIKLEITYSEKYGPNVRVLKGNGINSATITPEGKIELSFAGETVGSASAEITLDLVKREFKGFDVKGNAFGYSRKTSIDEGGRVRSTSSSGTVSGDDGSYSTNTNGSTSASYKKAKGEFDPATGAWDLGFEAGLPVPIGEGLTVTLSGGVRETTTPIKKSVNEFSDEPCSGPQDWWDSKVYETLNGGYDPDCPDGAEFWPDID